MARNDSVATTLCGEMDSGILSPGVKSCSSLTGFTEQDDIEPQDIIVINSSITGNQIEADEAIFRHLHHPAKSTAEEEAKYHALWRFAFWSRLFATPVSSTISEMHATIESNAASENATTDGSDSRIPRKIYATFSTGGLFIIIIFVPLSLLARFGKWTPSNQFWMSTLGLTGIYTQLWYTLKNSRIRKALGFPSLLGSSPAIRLETRDVELDLLQIFAVLLLDFVLALFFLFKSSPSHLFAFIVGSITYSNILVFGMTACAMGLKHSRTLFDSATAKTLCKASSFTVFTVFFVLAMKYREHNSGETDHWLTISRVAALFSTVLVVWLSLFTIKMHGEVFDAHDEDLHDFVTIREVHMFRQTRLPLPLLGMIATFIAYVALGVLLAEILTTSILNLSQDGNSGTSTYFRLSEFAPLVVVPCITKVMISSEVIGLGLTGRTRSTLMRSMGISVGHELLVLPLSIIAGWCFGRNIGYAINPWYALLLFLQWQLIGRFVRQGWSAWLTGVVFVGFYLLFVFWAWTAPLDGK